MFKKAYICSLLFFAYAAQASNAEKTDLLRAEVATKSNIHITQETHPTLYALVQDMTSRARIAMPKYITLYDVFYSVVDKDTGRVNRVAHNMSTSIDIVGDMYICSELLTTLSYDEARSALALVVAEKLLDKNIKMAVAGIGSFVSAATALFSFNKYYDLDLFGPRYNRADYSYCNSYNSYNQRVYYPVSRQERSEDIKALVYLTFIPAFVAAGIVAQNMQKSIDLKAAELVGAENIINYIKTRDKIQDTYSKESLLSRLFSGTIIAKICSIAFYPIRAYSSEERISYLQKIA